MTNFLRLNKDHDIKQHRQNIMRFLEEDMLIECACDLNDQGKMRFLKGYTYGKVRNDWEGLVIHYPVCSRHNAETFIEAYPSTRVHSVEEKRMFADAISEEGACKRLFICAILAGSRMAFLYWLVMDEKVTDSDLPLRNKRYIRTAPPFLREAWVANEPLVCPPSIVNGLWNYLTKANSKADSYRSSIPLIEAERRDDLKITITANPTYRVKFDLDNVEGFEDKYYGLTIFYGKPSGRVGLAGFTCEDNYYLVFDVAQ